MIDLASEMSESKLFRSLNYLQMTVPDLTAPNSAQIEEALGFIQHYAGDGMVYLHCKAGYSRTAVIAGAYLLATGRAENVDHAVALLRAGAAQHHYPARGDECPAGLPRRGATLFCQLMLMFQLFCIFDPPAFHRPEHDNCQYITTGMKCSYACHRMAEPK